MNEDLFSCLWGSFRDLSLIILVFSFHLLDVLSYLYMATWNKANNFAFIFFCPKKRNHLSMMLENLKSMVLNRHNFVSFLNVGHYISECCSFF